MKILMNWLLFLLPLPLLSATYTVTTHTDSMASGSLRWAVTQANQNSGADSIKFNLPAANTEITVDATQGPLPSITETVSIDGRTQPGYSGSPIVILDGSQFGPTTCDDTTHVGCISGLFLNYGSARSVIQGLAIVNFPDRGISIHTRKNTIQANFIGTKEGTIAAANKVGIFIASATNGSNFQAKENIIGGTHPGEGNVISGNSLDGIVVGYSGDNSIIGNGIGIKSDQSGALSNGRNGIYARNFTGYQPTTFVGGLIRKNTVAGNGGVGIQIGRSGLGLSGTNWNHIKRYTVENNSIGLIPSQGANSAVAVPNGSDGIALYEASYHRVHNNIIAHNLRHGLYIRGSRYAMVSDNTFFNNSGAGVLIKDGDFGVHDWAINNELTHNLFWDNGGLAIDLSTTEIGDGVQSLSLNSNDGPNSYQRYLKNIEVISATNFETTVSLEYIGRTGDHRAEFYAHSPAKLDSTGHGEAEVFIGEVVFTAAPDPTVGGSVANPNLTYTLDPVPAGYYLTATVTHLGERETSELSQSVLAATPIVIGAESEVSAIKSVQMYPNPMIGQETLYLTGLPARSQVKVFSIKGQQVFSQQLMGVNAQLGLGHLSAGIYIVRLRSKEAVKNFKLIKR